MALHDGHFLVCGLTRSGKGQLMRGMIERRRRAGVPVLYFTPKKAEEIEVRNMVDFCFHDPFAFFRELENCALHRGDPWAAATYSGAVAIIDEATVFFKQARREMEEILNQFAAYGVEVFVVVQRAKQVEPNIRNACDNIICFRQRPDDAAYVADQYGEEFNDAAKIPASYFLARQGAFGPLIRGRSFDDSRGFKRV
jgi:DNA helicase HerA-like ATPase